MFHSECCKFDFNTCFFPRCHTSSEQAEGRSPLAWFRWSVYGPGKLWSLSSGSLFSSEEEQEEEEAEQGDEEEEEEEYGGGRFEKAVWFMTKNKADVRSLFSWLKSQMRQIDSPCFPFGWHGWKIITVRKTYQSTPCEPLSLFFFSFLAGTFNPTRIFFFFFWEWIDPKLKQLMQLHP